MTGGERRMREKKKKNKGEEEVQVMGRMLVLSAIL